MIFAFLLFSWKCSDKNCDGLATDIKVPLQYWNENSENISLKVVKANINATKVPIVFLGPGYGTGNIPSAFEFVKEYFPENEMIFVGYRGIESEPALSDKHTSALASLPLDKVDDKLLTRIANKTQMNINLSDFWITQRAEDVISFLHEENIPTVNLIALGEDGSRIAHYIAAKHPNNVLRAVMLNPSVNIPHNDTVTRVLGVYRHICRSDPNCPFKNVRWIPKEIPKTAYGVFNVAPEKVKFVASSHLRDPGSAISALEVLQSLTEGSSMGYVALNGFMTYNPKLHWTDVALHVCAKPFDPSLVLPEPIKLICDKIPNLKYESPGKISLPMLIINGELDLPRPSIAIDYYKNESDIPTIIDHIVLEKASSRFELLRSDILKTVLNFLNDGNTTYAIDPSPPIKWTSGYNVTKSLKWVIGIGFAISIIGSVFIYNKAMKDDPSIFRSKKNK